MEWIRSAAFGACGLLLSSSVLAGGWLHHDDDDERVKVSPACHPTWGYHQTCWRRFRPLPPCDVCPTCPTSTLSAPCPDGQCPPVAPPVTGAVTTPVERPIEPQPDVITMPGNTSGRYGAGHGTNEMGTMKPYSHHPSGAMPGAAPVTVPLPASSGRYGSGAEGLPAAAPPVPVAPADLPPVPQSSALRIPAQSSGWSGGSRYGNRPVAQPSASTPRIPATSRYSGVSMSSTDWGQTPSGTTTRTAGSYVPLAPLLSPSTAVGQ